MDLIVIHFHAMKIHIIAYLTTLGKLLLLGRVVMQELELLKLQPNHVPQIPATPIQFAQERAILMALKNIAEIPEQQQIQIMSG